MVIVNKKWLQELFEPKGRLCVGGHRDPDLGKYESSSPTALMVAHMVLLAVATIMGWPVDIGDVTAAFLQGLSLHSGAKRVPQGGVGLLGLAPRMFKSC